MRYVLYLMDLCPFCKHFKRMFGRDLPDGEEVRLKGHDDPGWLEYELNYVPTVVVYDDSGKEITRLESERMVGIRKDRWMDFLEKIKNN